MIVQGDKCWVQSFLKKHYGICVWLDSHDQPWFVHNRSEGGVVLASEHEFAQGRRIHIEQRARLGEGPVVAQRAQDLIGHKYDLFTFNCEHVANFAANGTAESGQVQRAVAVLLTAALAALVNQNGTSVDDGGYRRDSSGRFASRRWW